MIAFGPVSSRRLGKSLGINNISSPKTCSYSCIYCQLGKTRCQQISKRSFYEPEILLKDVQNHINRLDASHKPDFLTFVSNGEPTLDIHLGREIEQVKMLGFPVTVITNGALLFEKNTREMLMNADLVSVKIDAFREETWKKINRPSKYLDFDVYLQGVKSFARSFKGKLLTETMLIKGVNDSEVDVNMTAYFLSKLKPHTAYLLTPFRPPQEPAVTTPSQEDLYHNASVFRRYGLKTELLTEMEECDVGTTGNAYEDILNISTVHPIREDTILKILKENHSGIEVLESLIHENLIKPVTYNSDKFFVRCFYN